MIASRRWPSATPGASNVPRPSGPRCASSASMRSTVSASGGRSNATTPQRPDLLVREDDEVERSVHLARLDRERDELEVLLEAGAPDELAEVRLLVDEQAEPREQSAAPGAEVVGRANAAAHDHELRLDTAVD